jgi:hypothetical protein
MSQDAVAYSDPRAAALMRTKLYHRQDDLAEILKLLEDLYEPAEAVIWLTRPNERLGWQWPLWCTLDEVKAVLATLIDGTFS